MIRRRRGGHCGLGGLAEVPSPAAARLIGLLRAGGWTIATCESMTGGGIGATLTSVPGSSTVFRGGLITYATDLKASLAGVDAEFVAEHGVINERTAQEMALGAASSCRADVGLSGDRGGRAGR